MSRRGSHRRSSAWSSSRKSDRGIGFYLLVLSLVVLVLVVAAGAYVGIQLNRSVPKATASVVFQDPLTAAGTRPSLPVPTQGSTEVAVEGVGTLAAVNANKSVPVASITKLITALVVLQHHPLQVGQQGPEITVPAAIGSAYPAELAAHDSLIPVRTGEHLSEYQCLEAMLIPSADNVANLLATWTAGSVSAFVAEMNAKATALGLHHTHFADASGLSAGSESSAADLVHLGEIVLNQPVIAQIVAMPQVDLPLAGLVYNYDYDLGRDGIVGIKTGSTLPAGGDFLFAAHHKVDGKTLTVVGAVLNQQGKNILQAALDAAKRLAVAAFADIHPVTLLRAGVPVVRVTAPWGGSTQAVTTRTVTTLGFSGERVRAAVHLAGPATTRTLKSPVATGAELATVQVTLPNGTVSVPATTVGAIKAPSLTWRLERL